MHAIAASIALVLIGACATVARPPAPRAEATATWPDTLPIDARIEHAKPLVLAACEEFDLAPDLMMALIWVESRFQPGAVSRAGARGLTQLMPGTAGDMAERLGMARGAAAPHDPTFAVRAGAAYVRLLLNRFQGDINTALAAYATGPGRVRKRLRKDGGLPGPARRYAGKVQRARKRFRAQAARPGA